MGVPGRAQVESLTSREEEEAATGAWSKRSLSHLGGTGTLLLLESPDKWLKERNLGILAGTDLLALGFADTL